MKFPPMVPLETSRLRLRHIVPEDLPEYHARLSSDGEVARYMLWQPNPDMAHTAAAIARIRDGYAAGSRYHWAIALKESNSLIGTIALLRFDWEKESCSFAYMLGKDYWGRGYGTEALRAVFAFAFENMEVSVIEADHFADNPASGAAMEKAGMQKTDFLPGQYEKGGVLYDAVQYSIQKEDWLRLQ